MKKYQDSFIAALKAQLEQWLDTMTLVPSADIYRFLHSIKGTASTIGLHELTQMADQLMNRFENDVEMYTKAEWSAHDIQLLLMDLIKACYEYQVYDDTIDDQRLSTNVDMNQSNPVILILDDDITQLLLLKEQLEEQGWVVATAVNPDRAISYFHEMNPDCLIVDLNLPTISGFDVIAVLQEQIRRQFIPMTIISVDDSRETRIKAYRMGADDFMIKPLDMEELVVRIMRQLERKKELDKVMFIDKLTGAYNRNYLIETFERQRMDMQLTHEHYSIAMVDIDYFKQVNDRYGHLAGDQVLAEFSDFMKKNSRAMDSFIRYGGEEFVMMLPDTKALDAQRMLSKLLEDFKARTFQFGQHTLQVSFSAGVVEVENGEDPLSDWLKLADQALYRAKANGRSRIELATTYSDKEYFKKFKVAIVDDDAIIRTMIAESIPGFMPKRIEADIQTYRDGQEFLDDPWHQDSKESVLVILDGVMPKMDGLDVLKVLRQTEHSERYRIIMLTARNKQIDLVEALRFGADDYMTKPFQMSEFSVRAQRLIQRMFI